MSPSSERRRRSARRPPARRIVTVDDLVAALPLRHGDIVELDPAVLSTVRQGRLNEQLDECGCDAGERGAAHGLLVAGCVCLLTGGRLRVAPTMVVGGLCGAGLGKFFGRRVAMVAARQTAASVIHDRGGSRPACGGTSRGERAAGQLVADGRR